MVNQATDDLWHRFKSGDDNALSKLYDIYVHKLFSYGLKIHGDEYLVKDCIQEVFIQLIDKRKTLVPSDSTAVYLFKSLRNKLLEELRSKNRRTDIAKSISYGDEKNEMSAEQSIVSSEEEQLRTKIIEKALNVLSDYQREAIFLKYSEFYKDTNKDGRMILKEIFTKDADMIPDYENHKLIIRLHSLSATRANQAVKELCALLNQTETFFLYTNLLLIYETLAA